MPHQQMRDCPISQRIIDIQRRQFRRLGVWRLEQEYRTMDPAYEATILRTFAEFVEQGLVYRSKASHWSIPCQTALAEAEVEYHNTKYSVYVTPALQDATRLGLDGEAGMVIWTTTPWTLLNLAIAVHLRLNM